MIEVHVMSSYKLRELKLHVTTECGPVREWFGAMVIDIFEPRNYKEFSTV